MRPTFPQFNGLLRKLGLSQRSARSTASVRAATLDREKGKGAQGPNISLNGERASASIGGDAILSNAGRDLGTDNGEWFFLTCL
jgi:hypothetical protein